MEIIPGVHDIDLGRVHAYIYQQADRLTLIDTGLADSAGSIVDAIQALARKPQDLDQIVVTHYHSDHMGSLAELVERTSARVLAHALDAPVVRGDSPEEKPMLTPDEQAVLDRITANVEWAQRCTVDTELHDRDELDLGDRAQIVHVPGHTAGSIAVYIAARRALFVGDAANRMPDGRLIVGVFNPDPERARASFRRLAELELESVFFGHGAPMDKDASLAFRRVAERLGS